MKKQKFNVELAKNIGARLADLFTVAAQHPASLALMIMATAIPLKLALAGDESTDQKRRIGRELGGLYAGAQGSLVALAAAPVITQGLAVLPQLLAKKPQPT